MECALIFGRNPKLAYAEFASLAQGAFIPKVWLSNNVLIVELKKEAIEKLYRLAGTKAIAEVVLKSSNDEFGEKLRKYIEKEKLEVVITIKDFMYKKLKNEFEKNNVKVFLSGFRTKVQIPKFMLIESDSKSYLLKCILFIDSREFAKHDKAKLFQEYEISTSVRLARMLINLSGKLQGRLLDPFCGCGTIVMEAAFFGFDAYGVEIDEKKAKEASKNIENFEKKIKLKGSWNLLIGDARNLSKYFPAKYFDAIVSEPYLGPPIKKKFGKSDAFKIANDLKILYKKFLEEAKKVLKDDGRVVIVVPEFRTKEKYVVKVDIEKIIGELNFKVFNPTDGLSIKAKIPARYKEPWHKIERKIYILEKIE